MREIAQIIDGIGKQKRLSDQNIARLVGLMERADFTPPAIDAEQHLDVIKRSARAASSRGFFSSLHFEFPRYRVVAGALAALVITVPSLFLYLWLFSHGVPSGKAVCSYVSGGVSLVRDGRRAPLTVGMALETGDSVSAGGNSLADFTVEGIAAVRVMEKTDMTFDDLAGNARGAFRFSADVARGTVLFTFVKLAWGDEAFVRTPVSVAVVRGTSFGVRVDPGQNARYEVLKGKIAVGGRFEQKSFTSPLTPEEREAMTPVQISAHQACTVSGAGSEKTRKIFLEVLAGGGSVKEAITAASRETSITVQTAGSTNFMILADIRNFVNESIRRTGSGIASLQAGIDSKKHAGDHPVSASDANNAPKIQDDGSFDFSRWAAGRDWSALAYSDTDGLVIGVSRGGIVEAVTRSVSKWSVNLGASITSPLLMDANSLYIALDREKIMALSRKSGKTLWVVPLQGLLPADSAITHYNGNLFAATSKGFLYRIAPTGNTDWIKKLNTEVFIQPFAQGPSLFVMGNDGNLYRLGVDDGEIKGTYALGSIQGGALDSRMNRLYLAGRDGKLVCFDHEKIEVLWRYGTGARISHIPVVDRHGVCLVTDSGEVHGIGLSGERRWKVDLGNRIALRATLSGSDLYIISDRALYLLDRHNGEVKWSYVTGARPGTPVVVAGRNILFGAEGRGLVMMRR